MARAREYVLLWPVERGTRSVRAQAAEREKRSFRRMQQEAGMLIIGVGNDLHTAHRYVVYVSHHFDRVGILPSANKKHESPESGGDASGSQVFCELSAGYLNVVRICDETSPGIRPRLVLLTSLQVLF